MGEWIEHSSPTSRVLVAKLLQLIKNQELRNEKIAFAKHY